MPSFWVEQADVSAGELVLRGDEAHHLTRVRRCHPGDRITAVDGYGTFYQAVIEAADGDAVRCRIQQVHQGWGESPIRLCLAAALVKGQRFDLVVEKATEVGVHSIRPMVTARGVVKYGTDGKSNRWNRVARGAVKQCDRSCLPAIHAPRPLAEVLGELGALNYQLLLAAPGADRPPLDSFFVDWSQRDLALLVGPEGGFDAAELSLAEAAGGQVFAWGTRVLRAETACVALSALVLHEAEKALRPS